MALRQFDMDGCVSDYQALSRRGDQ